MEVEDQIFRQLPDELVEYILSMHRRRGLIAGNFNFDISAFIDPKHLKLNINNADANRALKRRFFEWVDRILQRHRDEMDEAAVVNKLRIQFPLSINETDLTKIDEWVRYAISRRVRVLELDVLYLSDPMGLSLGNHLPDTLNDPLTVIINNPNLKLFEGFSYLRSLSLCGMHVTDAHIDEILMLCPRLEHLKVSSSFALARVEIRGSALTNLEILHCKRLQVVIVCCHSSLVSLTVTHFLRLVLEKNPNLASLCISYSYPGIAATFESISTSLSTLHFNSAWDSDTSTLAPHAPF